ncbi:putative clathrin assembly protein At4g40080 [Zingiber officinale]|uniref:ENTH domain-containing protein n=1 Tax=Zingiber officinale TaxID=94328 RepID=A0A8J5H9X6_ZINOF|nr:putative clathrin assembly protein At4g40080 [Zingiber officinale]KAG6519150.1 hypothetical protein ZIOFF_022639 [Zingiber officinale]
MGRKLRGLVGALKDTASFAAAAAATLSPSSAAQIAVLRATPHQPADEPPRPRHIRALLSFGHGSRLSAASAVGALTDRLRSTRDPAVALKCLLALHHVFTRGAFILRDQLPIALLRHPTSGRNPLALSAFPLGSSPASFALASWVRWYARLLELLVSASLLLAPFHPNPNPGDDRVTTLLDGDLISELDLLVEIVEVMSRAPEMAVVEGNNLVGEAVRLIEADRIAAEHEIEIRVREMRERTTSLGFADSVELVCVLRRLEETRHRPWDRKPTIGDWFWTGVRHLSEQAEAAALRDEEEEKRRFRRDKVSESARIGGRVADESTQLVHFGSRRWFNH